MTTMARETHVRLKVTSENLTPDEVTACMGLQCDKSWKIGDKRGATIIQEKTNGWIFSSPLDVSAPLDDHLRFMEHALLTCVPQVNKITGKANIELSIVIYSHEIPSLLFSRATINLISCLSASLDIDLYISNSD